MKSAKLLLILFYFFLINNCYAQNEANIWYFGDNAGVDFNSGSPVAIIDGALATREGCASVSDSLGNILFYTEGTTVWNSNHQIMDNGTGLLGDFSSTQSAIIVPKPGSDTLYYIFTVPSAIDANGELYYSIVDISLNSGLGSVITKNVLLYQPVVEKITATSHSNGNDVWVVTHERNSNAFCSFLVTSVGVSSSPVISNIGTIHGAPSSNYVGYMKISPMGNYIACAIHGTLALFEMLDFSRSSGQVSNPITFNNYAFAYGLEFSPDESRLYLGVIRNQAEVFQINLNAGTPNDIINSATSVGTSALYELGALQVGPDEKIYTSLDFHSYLGVINNPNVLGIACNFVHDGVYLDGKAGRLGLPSFIQSYFSATITYQNDCYGDTTYFDITTSDSIQSVTWNFGDPASGSNNTSTEPQPGHMFTAPGNFIVTASVVFNGGYSQDVTTEVTIHNVPQINIGNDTTLCQGASLLLDPGTGYSLYLWQDNSVNELFTVTQTGVYWVTVTNSNGCSTTDSITVSYFPSVNINLGSDSLYCFVDSILLHAGNNFAAYLWQDGSSDSLFTVYNNGTYWVEVIDTNGCAGYDTVNISFFRNTVNIGNDTIICSGNFVTLDAGMGFSNYLWSTGQTTQSIAINASGFYDVEASFGHCSSYDTMELTVQEGAFSYSGSNESVCQLETFSFTNCNILPNATNYDSLLWFGGLGAFSDSSILHPEYIPLGTELGDISLSLIAYGSYPCPNDTSSMTLTIDTIPAAGINVSPSSSSCVGSLLNFSGYGTTSITNWSWDFGDGSPSNTGQNVNHLYSSSGNYIVTLIVINSNNCSDTVNQIIVIHDLPTADFTYYPADSICINESVAFNDISYPNIVSWIWDFDDGITSTFQNPNHSFGAQGIYNVQLTVTDSNACEASINSSLQIHSLPEPNFTILPNATVCAELPLTFSGFDNAGTTITGWYWDFGDGVLDTGQLVTHAFAPGDYTVTLTALNNNSCNETHVNTVHINSLPQSNFTMSPNDTSCMGELINFDATNITSDIISWDWQFGDGNTSTGQNVTHIYNQAGNLNILSIYTNANGCIDTTIHQHNVQDVNIGFTMIPTPSCQDYTVNFTGTGDLVTFTDWNWTYGDGSAPGLGHNTSHIYTSPDTVDVILDVCSEHDVQQLIINAPCQVDAGSDEATCEDVYFDLSSSTILPTADYFSSIFWYTDGLGTIDDSTILYPTYFPDPIEGSVQNDTINMTLVGVGIPPCANDTSTMELVIIPGAYAQAGSDENSCIGEPYDFANSSDSAFATNYATIVWYTSGTGSFVNPNVEQPIYIPGPSEIGPVTLTMVASNIINCDSIDDMVLTIRPTYEIPVDITVCYYDSVYAQGAWRYASGIFYDTLQTNTFGCDSVIVTNLTVRPKIDRDFVISTGDSICLGETVSFTSTGTANLTSWLWDFGDGNTSSVMNPTHQYNVSGPYTVIYYYIDDNGCSDSATNQVQVFDIPDVDFTINMTNACVNTQVDFTGISNSNIALWEWDFGDGQTGAGQNTSHIYISWGEMTVGLTVTDINGCSETTYKYLTIAQPPIADFTYNIIVCDSMQFTDLSIGPPGYNLVMWHWDFGDGDTSNLQNPTHQYPSNTIPGGEIYLVTLTVVADSNGFMCSDSVVLPVVIPSLPDIFFTWSPDPTCLGDSTYFFGESGFPIDVWHWDFDDGNVSLDQYATHLFADTGTYNVTLTIADTNGCVNTLSNIITVNPAPEVSFTMSDSVLCHGNSISFTGSGSSNIAQWYWQFGDGSFSYAQNPVHYYPMGGSYTVTLTATDSTGCSASATNTVLI
ncbi:MAG: PKD domain-containing protein, partial [Bacteroidales bacterium]|nr:PKD domain-containing protein [Bacteroidales bacterium]